MTRSNKVRLPVQYSHNRNVEGCGVARRIVEPVSSIGRLNMYHRAIAKVPLVEVCRKCISAYPERFIGGQIDECENIHIRVGRDVKYFWVSRWARLTEKWLHLVRYEIHVNAICALLNID